MLVLPVLLPSSTSTTRHTIRQMRPCRSAKLPTMRAGERGALGVPPNSRAWCLQVFTSLWCLQVFTPQSGRAGEPDLVERPEDFLARHKLVLESALSARDTRCPDIFHPIQPLLMCICQHIESL